ncbi:hypothetical protein RJ640_000879 [Escallonia rubra]|uniref:Uncharacterized protein n=1 Tax=Escallonia rubra TaxID=112253 RepID=A0AA88QNR2_9ASTE|nr:hypothetical protein RJ640_000879 [Escallonia rubra]
MPRANRDPISNEMLKMRQQLECLQAELCARGVGSSSEELQVLKDRIAWLEATNEELCRELHGYRSRCAATEHHEIDSKVGDMLSAKSEGLKRGLQSMDSSDYQMSENGDSVDIDEEAAKEWEHTLLQDSMDKELNELNKRLEQKESEMKHIGGFDTMTLKQHFGKKIMELEDEKRTVQLERDRLLAEVENLAASSDGHTQKMQDMHAQKLKSLESQIQDLKKKQESQVQLLRQKQKSDEAAKRLQDEIQFKAQKVQLQHKIKQEAEQFRQWKASREKEVLQLRKEGRRNEYERHKLQALNQRQKMVLQRKTEEAAMATKRLKELLEARKSSTRENPGVSNGNGTNGQSNEKSLRRWLDHELEVMVNVHEVRQEYEKQSQVNVIFQLRNTQAALAEELAVLRQVDEFASKGLSPPRGKSGFARASSMSPNARMARISSLENMLSISSNSLVAMASQLSEAEERERAFTSRGRWNQLRSMADAKNLLQYMFNSVAEARCFSKSLPIVGRTMISMSRCTEFYVVNRCQSWEMEEQLKQLVGLCRQSEGRRKEVEKELKLREQALAIALATSTSVGLASIGLTGYEQGNSQNSQKHFADDMSGPLSPISAPAQKQLKYTAGIANGSVRESAAFIRSDTGRVFVQVQMVPIGQLCMKKLALVGHGRKLWRWKRSHHQWLLQFKWKWQKPWRLSELIRHSDETVMRARPRHQALPTGVYHRH